jgi:hypothetical protein
MKLLPLYAVIAFTTAISSAPAFAEDDNDVLFKFDGGIGSQPLRAGNIIVPPSTTPVPVPNTVAGVNPGGAPWPVESLKAVIKADGTIQAQVKGVLLGGTDNIGTRGGPRKMVASLFCRNAPAPGAVAGILQTVPYNSEFVDLDPNGDFQLNSILINAAGLTPTASCGDKIDNRPVLLIRTVTPANLTTGAPAAPGAWFAAGILKFN